MSFGNLIEVAKLLSAGEPDKEFVLKTDDGTAICTIKAGEVTEEGKKQIKTAVGSVLGESFAFNAIDIDENSLNEHINKYLTSIYENVNSFKATNCKLSEDNKMFVIEGLISYKSGVTRPTSFEFNKIAVSNENNSFTGFNKLIAEDATFVLNCVNKNRTLITENFTYDYTIDGNKVSGKTAN